MNKGIVHSDSEAEAYIMHMQLSSVFTDGDASNAPSLGGSMYSQLSHTRIYVVGVKHHWKSQAANMKSGRAEGA